MNWFVEGYNCHNAKIHKYGKFNRRIFYKMNITSYHYGSANKIINKQQVKKYF